MSMIQCQGSEKEKIGNNGAALIYASQKRRIEFNGIAILQIAFQHLGSAG